MLGSFSNWLSNNLPSNIQLPAFKLGDNETEKTSANTVEAIKVTEQPENGTKTTGVETQQNENKVKTTTSREDIDKIESVSAATATNDSIAHVADDESLSNEKEKIDISNDFAELTKLMHIDKQKAIDTAKGIGNFFLSFGKTASKQIQDTATHLKDVIEKNTIIGEFSKENEKFVHEKKVQLGREEAAVPPWVGYNDEEKLKQQILMLSQDTRNFLRNPPNGNEFSFDFNQSYPIALSILEEDQNLKEMRFKLVPKQINEEQFWRNYFYRVSLIKQNTELNEFAGVYSNEKESIETNNVNEQNSKENIKVSNKNIKNEQLIDITGNDVQTPQNNEFVSDSYDTTINEEEIKREMKQLKLDNNNKNTNEDLDDQDWDKELGDDDIDNITAEELEKEISQMIGNDIETK